MKPRLGPMCLLLVMLGCSGSAEKVSLSMEIDSSVTTASISRFVFLVTPSSSSGEQSLIFPSECGGPDGTCRIAACGFAPTDGATFDLKLPLGGSVPFPDGESIDVVACAYDSSEAAVTGGATSVINNDGVSATLPMTLDVTPCNEIPDVCP